MELEHSGLSALNKFFLNNFLQFALVNPFSAKDVAITSSKIIFKFAKDLALTSRVLTFFLP